MKDTRAENEIMDLLKKYVTLKVTVESFRKGIGRYLLGTEDIEWAKKTIKRKIKTYSKLLNSNMLHNSFKKFWFSRPQTFLLK